MTFSVLSMLACLPRIIPSLARGSPPTTTPFWLHYDPPERSSLCPTCGAHKGHEEHCSDQHAGGGTSCSSHPHSSRHRMAQRHPKSQHPHCPGRGVTVTSPTTAAALEQERENLMSKSACTSEDPQASLARGRAPAQAVDFIPASTASPSGCQTERTSLWLWGKTPE
jgi:hypothetical protein